MPRVHTQKANKDYPEHGIKKGDTYYWWKFRYGGKRKSKTYPKPSQLTNSDFLQRIYGVQEEIGELSSGVFSDASEFADKVEELKGQVEELRDESEEKRSNMPDHLQDVGSGEMLQNRYDSCEEMVSEFDNIDTDYDEPSDEELRAEALSELYSIEDEDDADVDEMEQINEADVETKMEDLRREKLDEWLSEKLEELQGISYNGE